MGKWKIAGCPLRKEGCPGLMECDGLDARRKLGPFFQSDTRSTAIICAYEGDPTLTETVAACEDEIQSKPQAEVPQPAE